MHVLVRKLPVVDDGIWLVLHSADECASPHLLIVDEQWN